METVRFGVGVVLPYVALAVFVGGMLHRLHAWMHLPSPAMTLYPAPGSETGNKLNALREAVSFRSLWNGDRWLWAAAWGFHAVLALILVGHLRVFANVDAVLVRAGLSEAGIQTLSGGAGGTAGVLILAGLLVLALRRAVVPRVREITGPADWAVLLLIAAVLATGNRLRFAGEHFELALARDYFARLATFGDAAGAPVLNHGWFLAHLGLALLLLMLTPFSKLLHLGGIFFTHQLIRKH